MTAVTYWVEWMRYNPVEDGCITHAVAEPGDGRALCGVRPTEAVGKVLDAEGVSCKRCTNTLIKRGVLIASGK